VSLVYVWLLWPITKKLLAHALLVFVVVKAIQSAAGLMFGDSSAHAFVWRAFLLDAPYAAIGLSLVTGWRFARSRAVA
jgi:hypothetical protein